MAHLDKTGYETKVELDADKAFLDRIAKIRRIAGERMGLGDVTNSVLNLQLSHPHVMEEMLHPVILYPILVIALMQ
ncbi:MAG: hypothetical protein ACKO11_15455 [Cuspidothrix sp.]